MAGKIDGFYSAHITGMHGQGLAVVVLRDGAVVGADTEGVEFIGNYVYDERHQTHLCKMQIKAPSGGFLVQGVEVGPEGLVYEVDFELPHDFHLKPHLRIETTFGPVNVRFKHLRGL